MLFKIDEYREPRWLWLASGTANWCPHVSSSEEWNKFGPWDLVTMISGKIPKTESSEIRMIRTVQDQSGHPENFSVKNMNK